MPLPNVFTTEQVAEQLHQTEETIREWARHGKLPGVRIGRSWLFLEEDLLRVLTPARPGDGQ